jgi:ribosomal protein L9
MKRGESGRIFDRATSLQVAEALQAKGFEVDCKKIAIEDIKSVRLQSKLLTCTKT